MRIISFTCLAPFRESNEDIFYRKEDIFYNNQIENLNAKVFGPARYVRASHFLREDGGHDPSLSFVAFLRKKLVGSIRMTPVVIGKTEALLLGPVIVCSAYKNVGIGSGLVTVALDAAKDAGSELVVLVGDEPYYRRFGFKQVEKGKIIMPLPVNPCRILAYEISKNALDAAKGKIRHLRYFPRKKE